MATKMTTSTPGGVKEFELDLEVPALVKRVNEKLKTNEKFFSAKLDDGKTRAFVAADVIAIWEE